MVRVDDLDDLLVADPRKTPRNFVRTLPPPSQLMPYFQKKKKRGGGGGGGAFLKKLNPKKRGHGPNDVLNEG
jgi:hypothetical protein